MAPQKVLGILAGTDVRLEVLVAWAQSADVVVAADGAANRLLGAGIRPDVIVGDLDSLDPLVERSDLAIEEDMDQEITDCDKLLLYVERTYGFASFSLTGLEGDRFDHVLASLHSIARIAPLTRLVLRDGFGWFVSPGTDLNVKTREGQTISMIPILPCQGVSMSGVQWPPNPVLSPLGYTSISNIAAGPDVIATVKSGVALVILQSDASLPAWE